MKTRLLCLLAIATLSATALAHAEGEPDNTVISGFGTLGGVYNSNDEYGFIRDLGQQGHPGRHYSWRGDSRLGVQVAHTFNPQWQVVGQLLVRDQADQTLDNTITRAFVSYRPTANLHLRLGRLADATFLMSDYMDVGYVYPWVRPPTESYGIFALRSYDGADVTYSLPDTAGVWRIKGLTGRIKAAIPTGIGYNYPLESNDLWGVALIRERGPLKVRIGYSSLHVKNPAVTPMQLMSGLNGIAASALVNAFYPTIASEAQSQLDTIASLEGARINYASAGFSYDDGVWVAQAEVSNLSSTTGIFPKGRQGYASVGYRVGSFTPYVMFSASRAPAAATAKTSWAVLGPDAVLLQQGALSALNAQRSDQTSVSLGMRWDFDSRAAFKLQWDHVRVRNHGWGMWSSPITSDGAAGSANLLSATVDFVF